MDFKSAQKEIKNSGIIKSQAGPDIIKDYKDTSGLSTRKLNFGLWIASNRKKFRQALIVFLSLIILFSWTYSIYNFAYYVFKGIDEDNKMIAEMLEVNAINHEYIERMSARDLIISPVNILKSGQDKYDFLTKVENPNSNRAGKFRYCLVEEEEKIACDENFIMPGENKYLLILAQELKNRPRNLKLKFENIGWQRINLHKYPDWNKFYDEHLNISVSNIIFKNAYASGLSEKLNFNNLEFKSINNTPYNYWAVDFSILFYSGNSIVGANKYSAEEFMSQETKNIQMSWAGNLSGVTRTEIIPEINILKDDIYIKYEGGIGEEK